MQDVIVRPLTTGQAGRVLGLSSQRVRQLIDAGKLVATDTPLGHLVNTESVFKLLEEREAARGIQLRP